jgi:hypothetical protein
LFDGKGAWPGRLEAGRRGGTQRKDAKAQRRRAGKGDRGVSRGDAKTQRKIKKYERSTRRRGEGEEIMEEADARRRTRIAGIRANPVNNVFFAPLRLCAFALFLLF